MEYNSKVTKFKPRKKGWNKRRVGFLIVGIIMFIYALTMILPLYYIVINSFKTPFEFFENVWSFPKEFTLDNYKVALSMSADGVTVGTMIFNSLIYTVASTLISTAAITSTAYCAARFNFVGKKAIVAIGIGAMLIPDLGSRAVIYKMYVDLKMIDTWWILFQFASPFGIFFLYSYSLFVSTSGTYAEAAKIDGASELRIYLQIMIPLAKGIISMMLVLTAIGSWNDYYTPYMYLPSLKTLALGIQELSEEAQTYSNFTELYATMVFALIPVMTAFCIMRDKIIDNAVIGGIKG